MRQPVPGDLLEIPLPSGRFAYIQVLRKGNLAPWVRVLMGRYHEHLSPAKLEEITSCTEYFTGCMVRLMVRDGLATVVHHVPVPGDLANAPQAVRRTPLPRDASRLQIETWDGRVVSPGEYEAQHPGDPFEDLPLNSIPMPDLFIKLLDAGWIPRDGMPA